MKIINIGDELLIGQVTNFNASFMGEHLSAAGFVVDETIIIGDNAAQIWKSIEYAFQETEVVILTGGLGPTKDDITKEVICRYFNTRLVMHDETLDFISDMLGRLHIPMSKINYRQALVPEIAKVLVNRNGTAPGLWIEQEGKILIALPGVPYEMQALMTESVIPLLVEKMTRNQTIIHKVVQLAGIGESTLSDLIEPWEISLPSYIKLAYLPRPGIIRLRLTGIHPDKELLEKELQSNIEKLKEMVEEYIFSYEDDQMEEVVAKLFRKNRKQLSIAESCTGGYLSHLITSVPGSSQFFKGSIVSYSNDIKREILNVRELNLKKHGAVSEFVVNDMAINCMGLFDTDYSVAVSGIAGPSGGTVEKPVGTVWIAVATTTRITTKQFNFGTNGGRKKIIERAAIAALNMLRIELLKDLRQ